MRATETNGIDMSHVQKNDLQNGDVAASSLS